MLHAVPIERCLVIAICFLLIHPYICYAEYPAGKILQESEVPSRFISGEIPADNLSELRLVRLPDSYERPPTDWNALAKAEQVVITEPSTIAEIVGLIKTEPYLAHPPPRFDASTLRQWFLRESPCPVLGACVAQLRNAKSDWFVVFFHAFDDHLVLFVPAGVRSSNAGLWRYIREEHPELLRPTKGAQLTAEASAQGTGVERVFYRDGSLRIEFPVVHGQYNGVAKAFNKSGQVSRILPYTDGKLNGIVKSYFHTGKLLDEESFVDGERHGPHRCYDENGEVLATNWFWHGKYVSAWKFTRLRYELSRWVPLACVLLVCSVVGLALWMRLRRTKSPPQQVCSQENRGSGSKRGGEGGRDAEREDEGAE